MQRNAGDQRSTERKRSRGGCQAKATGAAPRSDGNRQRARKDKLMVQMQDETKENAGVAKIQSTANEQAKVLLATALNGGGLFSQLYPPICLGVTSSKLC